MESIAPQGVASDPIVITGLGVYCSIASDIASFRQALLGSKKRFDSVDFLTGKSFRNRLAGWIPELPSTETRTGMRESVLLDHVVSEAVNDARLGLGTVDGSKVGVCIGSSMGGFGGFAQSLLSGDQTGNPEAVVRTQLNPWNKLPTRDTVANIPPALLAAEVARKYRYSAGISAPCTACSAGANSIAIAADFLRRGRAEVMLAGGVDPLSEMTLMGFNSLMAITTTEPAPFDQDRGGLLVGEGAAVLVLEFESHARRRGAKIYARLVGYGLSNDAYHATQPHPDGAGAIVAMHQALAQAGLTPEQVRYINMHGTGTKHNDRMELKALQAVFGEYTSRLPISSIKSMIGHTLGAAGSVEAVATVLAVHDDFLPPNLNFQKPMEGFDYHVVTKPVLDAGVDVAMTNSFAFGGNCASLIFARASGSPSPRERRTDLLSQVMEKGFEKAPPVEAATPVELSPRARLMVVAPHPDDEVIGCGGLLHSATQAGAEVTVLFLTKEGSRSLVKPTLRDGLDRRRAEAADAQAILRYARREHLDFEERSLSGVSAELASELERRITLHAPDMLLIPNPRDRHPDHVAAAHAALALLAHHWPPSLREVLLYEVWGPCRVDAFHVLGDAASAAKRRALGCYQSQLDSVDYQALLQLVAARRGRALCPDLPDAWAEGYERLSSPLACAARIDLLQAGPRHAA